MLTAGAGYAASADQMLERAAAAVQRAETAKNSADRKAQYKKALDLYAKIGKQVPKTPQAAEALYQTAVVNEKSSTKADLHNQLYAGHQTLTQLLNVYDKPQSDLEDSFGIDEGEARQIRKTVERARAYRTDVAQRLNKINSTDIKYRVLDFFVGITGRRAGFSYWFAIIIVTVLVKIAITPLTKAQFKAMKEMQKVAPLIKELQAKYKGDQKTIGEKTMELYKEHKINPFASCLPLLVQMPILMLLYYTIRSYEFQFANGTFLWIGSGLSHLRSLPAGFDQTKTLWITARNLSEPDLILVVLYVISMYISTKLSSVDPSQAEQQKMMAIVMPVMFAFIFAGFPSAFLLYWLVFNILQTLQQYMILRPGPGGAEVVVAAVPAPTPATPESGSGGAQRVRRKKK